MKVGPSGFELDEQVHARVQDRLRLVTVMTLRHPKQLNNYTPLKQVLHDVFSTMMIKSLEVLPFLHEHRKGTTECVSQDFYLFIYINYIYGLFNNAASRSAYIARKDRIDEELKNTRKEAVVVLINTL
jgi:hypothetical protein